MKNLSKTKMRGLLFASLLLTCISCKKQMELEPEIELEITNLLCENSTLTGTLMAEQEITGEVYFTLPYSGSSGGTLPEYSVVSSGVTGINAKLSPGELQKTGGTLKFVLTGKPSKLGTAIFSINLAKDTCSVFINVLPLTAMVSDLQCSNAKDTFAIVAGRSSVGVSIPYSGGNGAAYDAQTIASLGVTGLTATLPSGKLATGRGVLFYTITGIPSGPGTASFPIQIGSVRCTLTRTINFPTVQGEIVMKNIPAGTFPMGCSPGQMSCFNNRPVRNVTLSAFQIGETEVTEGLFKIMRPSTIRGDSFPVVEISWFAAAEFCNRLSIAKGLKPCYYADADLTIVYVNSLGTFSLRDGGTVYLDQSAKGYRLPTEAEWEYAARGGQNNHLFSGGNNLDEVGWYIGNSGNRLYPVKRKAPNGYGLYDMSGNAHEWCYDWYSSDYPSQDQTNPLGPVKTSAIERKVIRGGDFHVGANDCRVFAREGWTPAMFTFQYISPSALPLWQHGFRVARSL